MEIQRLLVLSIIFVVYLLVSSYLTVLLNQYFTHKKKEKADKKIKGFLKKQTKNYKQPIALQTAKNSHAVNKKVTAKNDVSEFQKIKTSEVVLPVIKCTVLEYGAGELGSEFPEITKLYYSEEALNDKEFLESVVRSPWNVQTHEVNTNEANIKVSGWSVSSWFDEKDKTVYAKGFLIGEENIDYAKENQNQKGFGTSAFISFLKIEKENGTTPEGLEYNAIARKAVCNHVAILPNIRDEKNKIVSINAKNAKIESNIKNKIGVKNTMEQSEFNALMEKYEAEKNSKNEETDKIVNAVLEKLNSKNEEKKPEPVNEEPAKEEKKPEPVNEDHKEPDGDEAKASNALPNERLVGIFAEHYGLRFSKTPTVKQLAEIAEIPYTSFSQALNALKKKSEELMSVIPSVSNSENKPTSISEVLKDF